MNKKYLYYILALFVGLFLGYLIFGGKSDDEKAEAEAESTTYTCSMHPQIRQDEPGLCPLCEMDLTPMDDIDAIPEENEVHFSKQNRDYAQVRTMEVKPEKAILTLDLNGKMLAAEDEEKSLITFYDARLEKLMVNYTGAQVQKGQTIAYLYAPDLIEAQKSLIEASRQAETRPGVYQSMRQKFKQWKFSDAQIDQIIKSEKVREQLPLLAQHSGTVTELLAKEGDQLSEGTALMEVTNFNRLWVDLEAYEHDLAFLKVGDSVSFWVRGMANENFKAKVNFISPAIDATTRVAKVRSFFDNSKHGFRPETLIRGRVHSQLYEEPVIQVPHSGIMWTGVHSVVYLENKREDEYFYEMREVVLGAPTELGYEIKSGLEGGENLVVDGIFTIDAAAQLNQNLGMMQRNPEEVKAAKERAEKLEKAKESGFDEGLQSALQSWLLHYLAYKDALVDTDGDQANDNAQKMYANFDAVKSHDFEKMKR